MMYKQVMANGKGSFNDFDLYINKRNIGIPNIKTIKETVPYMNGSYDFTLLNGEPNYEEREISYTFDIVGITIVEMEEIKQKVLNWAMNIQNTEIYDEYISNYYFKGSYSSSSWTEDGSAGELTLNFKVYPFMIAKNLKKYNITIEETSEVIIKNNGGCSIMATVISTGPAQIKYNNSIYSITSGSYTKYLKFKMGETKLELIGNNVDIEINFREESL